MLVSMPQNASEVLLLARQKFCWLMGFFLSIEQPKASNLVDELQSVKNAGSLQPKWIASHTCRKYLSAQNAAKMVSEQLLRQLSQHHCLHVLHDLHLLLYKSSFTRAL